MTGIYQVNRFLWGSLDWLFPPVCAGCKRVGYRWCPACQQDIRYVPEPICEICGLPIQKAGLCLSCSRSRPPYQALRSWSVFEGPIRQAIHSLKYRRNMALGDALAFHLARYVSRLDWPVDMIAAVPSGKHRLAERGYNQVALVARPMGFILKIRYIPTILRRARETPSQVGLSHEQRESNVAGAFQASPTLVSGKTILVVDDVATSGATLTACADALVKAGAKAVYGFTLARALPRHGLQIV